MQIEEPKISDILKDIQKAAVSTQPNIDDYIKINSTYFDAIKKCLDIIKKYAQNNIEYAEMCDDEMFLTASHANMSLLVGYLQGMSTKTDDIRKITKSQYAIKIKDKKAELLTNNLKLTDFDVEQLSTSLAEDHTIAARDTEIVSRMITNAWYAIENFIDILKSSIYREHKELYPNGKYQT